MMPKGYKHTERTKRLLSKLSKKQWDLGRVSTVGWFRKGQMPWNKGLHIPVSRGVAKKMSETKKRLHREGRLFTKEHLANIRKSLTGRKLTKPVWNKGKKLPQFSGKNHPNWRGSIKNENDKRKSYEMVAWRMSVFSRDDWTCRSCMVRGGTIHPHHIFNYSQYPELRDKISNGITLCVTCHRRFHHQFGRQNNTDIQLAQFLKCGLSVLNQKSTPSTITPSSPMS
jgi:hypothetical protein